MNPFAKDQRHAISSLGESKLIESLRDWLGDAAPASPYGMGDDCAVLPQPTAECRQLVTADPIIYGSHFNDRITPRQAAAKLLRRNLSDIAAMGGRPNHAVVSLALDPNVSISWIKAFYSSLADEARSSGVTIVGGDVSSTDRFIGAFLTLYGETLPNVPPLLRRAAEPGSPLFVTGTLGGTRITKHHAFTPRLEEGRWLANCGLCLSCSDLSDGLGKDFANVVPPNLACEIDCAQLPASPDAAQSAIQSGKPLLDHVFNDGEDFELIFALKAGTDLDAFQADWRAALPTRVSHIGYAETPASRHAPALVLKNAPEGFSATGYEHLR